MRPPARAQRSPQLDLGGPAAVSPLVTLTIVALSVVALYFGREIFVPLALAMLLSFALAPVVRWLRRLYLPNIAAVLSTVILAFLLMVIFGWTVAWQVTTLAQRLPAYQQNIEAKIDGLRASPPGGNLLGRATEMVRELGRKMDEEAPAPDEPSSAADPVAEEPTAEPAPIPVEVHEPKPTSLQILQTFVGPLINPIATAGIVIVFVVFMLLKREDLRDRLIRLVGPRDLPRTTQAMNDAAGRVGHYLLMQLVVNTTYGIPIGIGLWLIGVPNPILWALLCTILRFVPYIGPIIAAFFPLVLAVAVDPGWTLLLWTGALFLTVELVSNNFVEPWLYGASTGLSPLAIIAAAVFWTWLWGPIGLLLSTPLTVCLVVLGRHVPQLSFLDVLLGNEPVLTRPEQLYQRLLVGDADEATERAEEFLRESSRTEFYDEVAIPALALAEHDRARGALHEDQRRVVADSAVILLDNLAEWEDTREEAQEDSRDADIALPDLNGDEPPGGQGLVVCAGARGALDDAAAGMLGQLLEQRGVEVRLLPHESLQSAMLQQLDLGGVTAVALSYMNSESFAHARFLVRRIRRRFPDAAIVVGFWTLSPQEMERRDPIAAIGADRVATSLAEAVPAILDSSSRPLSEPSRRREPHLRVGGEAIN